MIRRAPLPVQQQSHHHHHRLRHQQQRRSGGSAGGSPSKSIVLFHLAVLLLSILADFSVLGQGPHCNQVGHGPSDIIMASGQINPKYTWYKRNHETYVPVVMDPTYSHKEHSIIVGGLNEIMDKTCVRFDFYDDEHSLHGKDYVYITRQTKRGCWSYIGRIGRGKQEIGLPPGCITHRTAMHEMMHALGFRHEHVRHDRDEYIIIFWSNIKRGRESNFQKRNNELSVGPYDYESIMHYDRRAFSNNGMDTIQPLKNGVKIGVRQKMSHWDAKKINIMYSCSGNSGGGGGHLSWSPEHDDPDLIDDALSSHIPRNASSSPPASSEIEVAYDELDYDPGGSSSVRGGRRSSSYGRDADYHGARPRGNFGSNHLADDHDHHHHDNHDQTGFLHNNNNNDYDDDQHDGRGNRNHFDSHHGNGDEDNRQHQDNHDYHNHQPQSYSHFSLDSYPGEGDAENDDNTSAGGDDDFDDFSE